MLSLWAPDTWLRMLESQGQAKEKESPADLEIVLSVVLRFNADNF